MKHAHCMCEDDHADFRRGRYEPAERPEAEHAVAREREKPAAVQPVRRATRLRRNR